MTFRQWLIKEVSKAKANEDFAHKRHRKSVKETGTDGCDSWFYALETTTQIRSTMQRVLRAHRTLTDKQSGIK